jgi:hypothetical protein
MMGVPVFPENLSAAKANRRPLCEKGPPAKFAEYYLDQPDLSMVTFV